MMRVGHGAAAASGSRVTRVSLLSALSCGTARGLLETRSEGMVGGEAARAGAQFRDAAAHCAPSRDPSLARPSS